MINLSLRLKMIASLVPNDSSAADIGADHGYLIAYLKENGIIKRGLGVENKIGPYNILKANLKELGEDIETSLSDGITYLPSDIDTIIIAGMGKDTIIKIFNDSLERLLKLDNIIISSHGKMDEIRTYLVSKGYYIANEDCVIDENKYYEVSLFKKGHKDYSSLELKYGPILLQKKNEYFIKHIKDQLTKIEALRKENLPLERIEEIINSIKEYQNVLDF